MEEGFTQRTRHQFIFAMDMAVSGDHQQVVFLGFFFRSDRVTVVKT